MGVERDMRLLGLLILSMLFVPLATAVTHLTDCATLSTIGETYIVDNYVYEPLTDCFTITAHDVTLNCNNYVIEGAANGGGYFAGEGYGNDGDPIPVPTATIPAPAFGTQYGVKVSEANATVMNCKISNFTIGVYVSSNYFNTTISNNQINVSAESAIFSYGSNGTITGNLIYNNNETGIRLHGANYTLVSGNNASYNNHDGIFADNNSAYNVYSSNNLDYNNYSGISFHSSTHNTVYKNTMILNEFFGQYTQYAEYLNFTNNTVAYNGGTVNASSHPGLSVYFDTDNSIIVGNNLTANKGGGVWIYDSVNGYVENNTAYKNLYKGISAQYFATNTTIKNNNASANTIYGGILVLYSNNSIVLNNSASDASAAVGIRVEDSKNCLIENNTILRNAGGLYFLSSGLDGNNSIFRNTISSSTTSGVYIVNATNSTFQYNNISYSGTNAFRLSSNSSNMVLRDNTIHDNARAWFLEGCSSLTLINETSLRNANGYFDFDSNVCDGTATNVSFNSSSSPLTVTFSFNGDINLNSTVSPASDPSNYTNVTRYLNVSASGGWAFINFTYADSDIHAVGFNTSNVKVLQYTSFWTPLTTTGTNRAGNYSYGNVTTTGYIAPMAEVDSINAPVITDFYDMPDINPISCSVKPLGATRFNVSDSDGASDINLSATYVEIVPYSGGLVVTQSTTCVNDTSVIHSNPNEMTINCTGGVFNYYAPSLTYKAFLYVEDNSGSSTSYLGDGIYFNYNTLISATVSPLISFGNLVRGSTNNLNNNTPSWNMTNCGNAELSTFITGMNISDGGSRVIGISNFKVSDDAVSGGDIVLNESSIDLTSLVDIVPALNSYQNLWFFVDIPSSQYPTTYNNGYWVWTPYEVGSFGP